MPKPRDTLFLLKPRFPDPAAGRGEFYCPHCAALEGVLVYYPEVASRIELVRVDFQRPRTAVIELLGETNQGCPVLVLGTGAADATPARTAPTGRRFLDQPAAILGYLADRLGIGRPHP